MVSHAGTGVVRRTASVAVLVTLLVLISSALPWIDSWARSLALFGDVIMTSSVRPVTWMTREPTTEMISWGSVGGTGMITRPVTSHVEGSPALIVVLGADPAPPDDPRVVRFVDSLARLGFVVLLPLSDELEAKLVTPVEIERLVQAALTLDSDQGVRSDRIAFVGLSTGGSLSIVAAADERIADEVWFVLAIGPYFDAKALAASIVTRSIRTDDDVEPWEPEQISVDVLTKTLLARLSPVQRESLMGVELDRAEVILEGIDPELRLLMEGISPRSSIGNLSSSLYLLHDREDHFVPWTESDALAAVYEPTIYHRLDLFEHVEPEPGNLPVLARDGWRLMRMFSRIFREAQ